MWRTALTLLVPPLCATCSSPCTASEPICAACRHALAAARGGTTRCAGVEVTWAAPYDGVARDLITALKFAGRLPLAAVAAGAIAAAIGRDPLDAVVAVPAAPVRHRRRGFDPASLIAASVAARLGLPSAQPLRRRDGPRQVGRRRHERLADPPQVGARAAAPESVLLVDDVLTTGATLGACAAALLRAGTTEVRAGTFARALGSADAAA